jgi:hypothetical protein
LPQNSAKICLNSPLKKNPNTFQFICKSYPIYALKPPTPKPQKIDLILAPKHLEILPQLCQIKENKQTQMQSGINKKKTKKLET